MLNIAVIPARGGSKRIPRKNIRQFVDKPMLAHSIENALESGVIDKVVVSTEDREIADVAIHYGADVPFLRPQTLADDITGTSPVVRHTLSALRELGWELNYCACIYATAPLLTPGRIADALTRLKAENVDYIFTAAAFSFPIQRAIVKTESGGVEPFDKFGITQRSQDLPPAFHDAGQLYWGTCDTWLDTTKHIFSPHSQMMVLPSHLVQDIDTEGDWRRAELLYRLLKQEKEI